MQAVSLVNSSSLTRYSLCRPGTGSTLGREARPSRRRKARCERRCRTLARRRVLRTKSAPSAVHGFAIAPPRRRARSSPPPAASPSRPNTLITPSPATLVTLPAVRLDGGGDGLDVSIDEKHGVERQPSRSKRGRIAQIDEHGRDRQLPALAQIDLPSPRDGPAGREEHGECDVEFRADLASQAHVRGGADAGERRAFDGGGRQGDRAAPGGCALGRSSSGPGRRRPIHAECGSNGWPPGSSIRAAL